MARESKFQIQMHGTSRTSIQLRGASQMNVQMVTPTAREVSPLPEGGLAGDILMKRSNANYDAEWVPPADSAEKDNTRPITAAAVYTEIGNINALLATI